jgi:hypothetical protein
MARNLLTSWATTSFSKEFSSVELVHGRSEVQNELYFLVFSSNKVNRCDWFCFRSSLQSLQSPDSIQHAAKKRSLSLAWRKARAAIALHKPSEFRRVVLTTMITRLPGFSRACYGANCIQKQTRVEMFSRRRHVDHSDFVYHICINFCSLHITTCLLPKLHKHTKTLRAEDYFQLYIAAYRPIARQRLQNKQLYNGRYWVAAP